MSNNRKSDKTFEQIVLIASVAYPLTTLPQILKVYSRHSAHDLSLLSWVLYAALELIFLIYAARKRLLPLIIQNALWLVVYLILVVAILLYGNR